MDHDYHRRLQRLVLDRLLEMLTSDSGVLGVVTAGSLARGRNDAFSDLDVGCFLRDQERSSRERLYEGAASIAPILCKLWIYDRHALYLFENGVRLDLDFLRPSDLAQVDRAYSDATVVYDPDGALERALPAWRQPRKAQHPKWFEVGDPDMVEWFFWMFRQVVCWAKRGAKGDHRSFDKLSNAVASLGEVRTRLIEMRLWTMGREEYLGTTDPDLARRLAGTYPHLETADIVRCARLLLDEYQYVCPRYCEKAGAAYPARKVGVIRGLIDEFDKLD